MKTLERGFKAWSERTSIAIRKELDLTVDDPLPPQMLANYLDIQLLTPRDFPGLTAEELDQLLFVDPSGWSAVSIPLETGPIIIFNPCSSKGRQASDVLHEIAHVILNHRPATILYLFDADQKNGVEFGLRSFDPKQEDEASWLGWTLLLPREGLVNSLKCGRNAEQIADHYGVSKKLAEYRLNITGLNQSSRSSLGFKRKK